MIRLWNRWVDHVHRPIDSRPLGLMRLLVPLCVLLDQLRVAQLGLVETYYRPFAAGGLSRLVDGASKVDDWFGDAQGGIIAFWVSVVAMASATLGFAMRPALLIGVLAYAQAGHIYQPGDRGIDRILRTAMLILICSGADRRFALNFKERRETVAAWPSDLVRVLMVCVYLSAGVSKLMQQPRWLATSDAWPVVYRILVDPLAAHIDPLVIAPYAPWFVVLGWATILVECSSPLLLTRFARYWSLLTIPMHLGIAQFMELGMFSYGMLSLHIVVLWPWIAKLADRVPWLARRAEATG